MTPGQPNCWTLNQGWKVHMLAGWEHQKSYRPSSEPPERPSNERLRHARFEQNTTLEEFDFAASPKLPAAQIRDLAALR
jgi:hypothetical protein